MHLWILNNASEWEAYPLTTMHYLGLTTDGTIACRSMAAAWQALLYPWQDARSSPYLLLIKPGSRVRLNGQSPLSLTLLQDHDEIALGSAYAYYTTEVLAEIVPFAGADETMFCARCKSALATEGPAVQCPACRLWYHETEAQPCWSYAQTCVCSRPTTTGAFVWQPQPVR